MPLLVNKLIFALVPGRVPLFLRPFAKVLFGGVSKNMLDPRIAANIKFVSRATLISFSSSSVLKHTFSVQINAHLTPSAPSPWLAHGAEPTSADFMMLFPLEAIGSRAPEGMDVGEGIKRFVTAVHERPAYNRALEKGGKYKYAEQGKGGAML